MEAAAKPAPRLLKCKNRPMSVHLGLPFALDSPRRRRGMPKIKVVLESSFIFKAMWQVAFPASSPVRNTSRHFTEVSLK